MLILFNVHSLLANNFNSCFPCTCVIAIAVWSRPVASSGWKSMKRNCKRLFIWFLLCTFCFCERQSRATSTDWSQKQVCSIFVSIKREKVTLFFAPAAQSLVMVVTTAAEVTLIWKKVVHGPKNEKEEILATARSAQPKSHLQQGNFVSTSNKDEDSKSNLCTRQIFTFRRNNMKSSVPVIKLQKVWEVGTVVFAVLIRTESQMWLQRGPRRSGNLWRCEMLSFSQEISQVALAIWVCSKRMHFFCENRKAGACFCC